MINLWHVNVSNYKFNSICIDHIKLLNIHYLVMKIFIMDCEEIHKIAISFYDCQA